MLAAAAAAPFEGSSTLMSIHVPGTLSTLWICNQGAAPGAVRVGIIGTGWGAKVGFAAAQLGCETDK